MNNKNPYAGPSWELASEYPDCNGEKITADDDELANIFNTVLALNRRLDGDQNRVAIAQQIHRHQEQAESLLGNMLVYANCRLSVDSGDEAAQALQGRLQAVQSQFSETFEPLSQFELLADDTEIANYLQGEGVSSSEFRVNHARKRQHESLSLSEENLVSSLAQNGIHAWGRLYDQLSGTLQCNVLVGNEVQSIGIAQASGMLQSADVNLRKHAWQGINSAWAEHEESCAAAINAIAGWRLSQNEKRSGKQPVHYLDAPLHMSRISRKTLDAILSVAQEAAPLARRAAKLQAKAYGVKKLGPWDIRAPAPTFGAEEQLLDFDSAITLVAQAYGEVAPEMGDFVNMMVANRWVEGTVGATKRPGAYCTGFPKSRTPRVYTTYTGETSNIITLAHELGHAFHSWVMRDLPESQKSYGMSLAETASTFGETIVRDALLDNTETPAQALGILWEEMNALVAFVLNIPTRFEFERNFYETRKDRPLRPAELSQMMSDAWITWYDDAIEEPDALFWANKLHFYISGVSFYNFPYLFGYLFSLGVYRAREKMADEFYANYVALLRDTGRMTAEDIATTHLSANLESPEFWREVVFSLESRVDKFENLLEQVN